MKHILQIVVDVLPGWNLDDSNDGMNEESFAKQELAWLNGDNMNIVTSEYQSAYYTKEDFIGKFTKRLMDFYSNPENQMDGFSGCLEGLWFDCSIEENDSTCTWEDLEFRDLYSIKVEAFKSLNDYNDGFEMEFGQGGMVDFYSQDEIDSFCKDGRFVKQCEAQAEFAYEMIFP